MSHLTLQLFSLFLTLFPLVLRACSQHFAEPVGRFVVLLHGREGGEDLLIYVAFGHPIAGMAFGDAGHGAAVIDVLFSRRGFNDLLTRDEVTAMAAADQSTGIGQFGGFIRLAAEKALNAVPCLAIHQRFVPTRVPLALILDFAEVSAIVKDVVDAGPRKLRPLVAEHAAFGVQLVAERVDRIDAGGEQIEDLPHVVSGSRIKLRCAAASRADVLVAVRPTVTEPAIADAALVTFADVDGLLIGVERRHVGQRAAHNAAGGVRFHRLRNRYERHAVVTFQLFQFDKIKNITCGPVHFIEQNSVDLLRMLLGVGEHRLELGPLGRLAGRFGDAEQLDDRAASLGGVLSEGFFLHGEAESFAFLLPTAHARKGNVSLAHLDVSGGAKTAAALYRKRPKIRRQIRVRYERIALFFRAIL